MTTIPADHRTDDQSTVALHTRGMRAAIAWLPLAVLPLLIGILTSPGPAWIQMWSLAVTIYACCKWLTLTVAPVSDRTSWQAGVGYLTLWTGMNADEFFGKPETVRPRWSQSAWAAWQMAVGVFLLLHVAPNYLHAAPLLAGWMALTGVVSALHFGLSQLLSIGWRAAGFRARHIMHKPLLASSLADFWGRRWNLAFRDLMHQFVFQPLLRRLGGTWSLMSVFLVSGLIHDAVISIPAGGGWGRPTLYFLIQGFAQWAERSAAGRRVGLGRGILGRVFAAIVIVAPVGLLFHGPFIESVVLPMVRALKGTIP